jgi:GDP-mannose 6-dehydrogenase
VLNSIDESNEKLIIRELKEIERYGKRKIGILGLSFKAGTDDMRNSPIIQIVESLYGKGYEVRIYDKNVSLSRIIGKNKSVVEEKLPHISTMLKDNIDEVTKWAELLVIANKDDQFSSIDLKNDDQIVIDLVRIKALEIHANYNGLWW